MGEHQRYAYRITDATIGQAVEGRDLFTGAGSPVEPDRALRDLATFLSTAGDARQRAPDHPGSNRGNAGLFPVWVPEAAHTSADALAELSEHGPIRPEEVSQRWINTVFLQGDETDQVLDVIDRDGQDVEAEEFVAKKIGQDLARTTYDVDRTRRTEETAARETPARGTVGRPAPELTGERRATPSTSPSLGP
ncbi:hypothetical protein [Auritidibacter sp. NML100628]|uniref:hypothetical protein n=1 Tax=Auritidibacter sp. NML100628 TaxID=2170742 RepID=UPI001F36561F|nr:hypothetical protein [Auritidibacter sp. NML100628]